ncbi:MAG: 4'-phosphopantetheinyl transferase superfamily protein [Muribaculaceae bacterium]|nr:4'-phosphopantetheinyl transferase superfamily protein [Muribaculaceae bacterium]
MIRPDFRTERTGIYLRPLPEDLSRGTRHEAERTAVLELVRQVLGADCHYGHAPDGAPFIAGIDQAISVSHGAGMAVLAVSTAQTIGIDAESWRPQLLRIAGRYLSAREQSVIANVPEGLLNAWTAKEAVYKAARIPGLALSEIETTPTEATARELCFRLHRFGSFPISITLAEPKS